MPLDLRPDKYRVNNATGNSEPVSSTPYVRMVALGRPTIMLQAGVYYYESGEIVPHEKLVEFGLPTDFAKEGVRGMDPHPLAKGIIDKAEKDSIEQQAYRLVGGR